MMTFLRSLDDVWDFKASISVSYYLVPALDLLKVTDSGGVVSLTTI